jgi:DNA-binding transcriptional MerR regulator
MPEDLLSAKTLALILDVTPATIRRWVCEGIIPEIQVTPKIRRFCYADVLSALRARSAKKKAAK